MTRRRKQASTVLPPLQHPGGRIGDTPGVDAAPEALAGSIVAGSARFIETPSMQAELFGLGMTAAFGSMPVPPTALVSAEIVPGTAFTGTCEIDNGRDAALVTCPPGVELHATVVPVPAGAAAETVPMELMFCPMTGRIGAARPDVGRPMDDTVGVAGTGVGDDGGAAQTTTVPGVVGSDASGTGANVVSGAPDTVVAENGPGLLSGEITIAPGTVGRSIAVLPVVATCAWTGDPPSSTAIIVANTTRIIARAPSSLRSCER
ncbi:hypothetical protein ACU4GH_41205 [Bradyrhizobium betae]